MYGIEKNDYKDVSILKTSPRYYGMVLEQSFSGSKHDPQYQYRHPITGKAMALGHLTWLVCRGDLIPSDKPRIEQWEFEFNFRDEGARTLELPLYEYLDDDQVPQNFEISQGGKFLVYRQLL